jgi:hypothetical protein
MPDHNKLLRDVRDAWATYQAAKTATAVARRAVSAAVIRARRHGISGYELAKTLEVGESVIGLLTYPERAAQYRARRTAKARATTGEEQS